MAAAPSAGRACAMRRAICWAKERAAPPISASIPDLVWNSILTACREALSQAGLQESDLGRIHAGMGAAGAGQTSAVERLLARAHPFASFEIDTDAHTAWLGAFNGGDGAILIVGTGSCGYGGVSGQCHYVGGWGYEISDEGSGAAIGRELLRRCIWAHDGRIPATPLSDAVLAEFKNDLEILVDWVGKARPSDYGRYAPLVLDYAERRDPLAHRDRRERRRRTGADRHPPARSRRSGHLPLRRPRRAPAPLAAAAGPAHHRALRMADALDGAILLARTAMCSGGQHEPALREALALLRSTRANPTPLYLQLQQSIEEAVRKGALKADEALPGERDLAKQLGISRVTVRKAITGLVKKGVLVQRWGSGTFIAPQMRLEQPLSRLSSFTDDMSARGLQSSAVMLEPLDRPGLDERADGAWPLARRSGEPRQPPAPGRRHPHGDRARRHPVTRSCPTRPSSSNRSTPCCTSRASCRAAPCSGCMRCS